MTNHRIRLLLGILALVLALAPVARAGERETANASAAEVAAAWFNLLYDVVKQEGYTPPVASRIYGIAGVTLYEAVVPGSPEHRSLAGQLNGLASMPQPKPHPKHHWPTVANAALGRLLGQLLSGASATSMTRSRASKHGSQTDSAMSCRGRSSCAPSSRGRRSPIRC